MKRLNVIKIGGGVIDDTQLLEKFLDDLSNLPQPFILVHGGGALASELCKKLCIEVKMVRGRRITDDDTLQVAVMVYAGLINKQLTAAMQKRRINAVGLSGTDGDCIRALRRVDEEIDWGNVGDVSEVDSAFLDILLRNGYTPVICAITHDRKGTLLNTNADTIATEVAIAMSTQYEVALTYCFDKQGVLSNPDDKESIIENIDPTTFAKLSEKGVLTGGMIPKLENAFRALGGGVKEVTIKHAGNLLRPKGTYITP